MGWMRAAAVLVAWTLLSVTCPASDNSSEVPFKLHRGYLIVVRGSIGSVKHLNMLVDTGAVPSVVDLRVARRLHLRGQGERLDVPTKPRPAERAIVSDVEVGPLHVRKLSTIILDLSFAEQVLGIRVDAMIGFDVLGQSPFTIDYESRKLVFGSIDPSFVTVPYSPDLPYAVVPLHIQHETLGVLADTGASNLVLFQSGVRNCRPALNMLVGRETWTGVGGEMAVARAQLANAYLGAMPWGKRAAYIPENSGNEIPGLAGLLGTVELGKRVAFDPVRRVVAWELKEP